MGREFELKYRADAEVISGIREKFGEFTPISMETAYYDTPDGQLSRLHWTLRRRYENGCSVCTLKTPAPDGSRGEWETFAPSIEAAIPALVAAGAPERLADLAATGLVLSCGARFTRLAKTLELADAVLELALDRGVLLGGGEEQAFAEVEAELKAGREETVRAFAEALAAEFSLEEEHRSKHARAVRLASRQ